MTSFHDTNYAGQGQATAAMLDKYDLVLSHVEAPDEASHQADYKTKVESKMWMSDDVPGKFLKGETTVTGPANATTKMEVTEIKKP